MSIIVESLSNLIANDIKEKTPEEIRKMFGLEKKHPKKFEKMLGLDDGLIPEQKS